MRKIKVTMILSFDGWGRIEINDYLCYRSVLWNIQTHKWTFLSLKATKVLAAPNSPVLKYSVPVSTDCLFWLFNIPSLVFFCFFFVLILLHVLSQMLSLGTCRILLGSGQSSCDPPLSSGGLRAGWTQVSSLGWCALLNDECQKWRKIPLQQPLLALTENLLCNRNVSNVQQGISMGWSQLHCKVWYRRDRYALSMALE